MAYAFEGYACAEFRGGTYSCAGGLPADVIGYLPAFLPNTTSLQARAHGGGRRENSCFCARFRLPHSSLMIQQSLSHSLDAALTVAHRHQRPGEPRPGLRRQPGCADRALPAGAGGPA